MGEESTKKIFQALAEKIKKLQAPDEEKQTVIDMLERLVKQVSSREPNGLWEAGKFAQLLAGYSLVNKDELYETAFDLYSQAAEKGYPPALRSVGQCYMCGFGVPTDEQKGIQYYQQAADLGNEFAAIDLAVAYFFGSGVEQDQNKAIRILEEKAAQKSAEAMNVLGSCYSSLGNYEKAVYWFEKAFQNGSNAAAFKWATIYLSGLGTERDIEKGTALLKKAANAGSPDAQYYLAMGYIHGEKSGAAIEKDTKQGIDYLKKAVLSGSYQAYQVYGEMLIYGENVEKNLKQGIDLLTAAAAHGNDRAQADLGDLYYHGTEDVEPDYKKSFYWADQAYKNGNKEIKLCLSALYYEGLGVEKDREKAIALLQEAAADGFQAAEKILNDLLNEE